MSDDIEIKELPPQPVLSIRKTVTMEELPAFIGISFSKLFPYLASLGEAPAGAPLALYYGEPTQQAIDAEICVPTSTVLQSSEEIKALELPGGRFASLTYVGPYEAMSQAYEKLAGWIADEGYSRPGPSREIYLVGMGQAEPDAYVTDILFPI